MAKVYSLALFLILPSGCATAQTLSLASASGSPGTAIDLAVSFSHGSTPVTGFLFDLKLPSSLSYCSVAAGAAASAAGKSVSGNVASGGARILVFGINQNAIGPGPVATIRLNIAAGTAAGDITVSIGNISASDPSGIAVTVAGGSAVITITSNSNNNGSDSGDAGLTLYYPSVSSPHLNGQAAAQSDEGFTSVALTNLDTRQATISFTAYDRNGIQLSGNGVTNPVAKTLQPGEQVPIIDSQLFGEAASSVGTPGWIRVDSSTSRLAGFFMTFSSQLTFLDGADIASSLAGSFVFPEVLGQGSTGILLSNPNGAPASVRLDLVAADGSLQASSRQTINAGATLSGDLFSNVFAGVAAAPDAYVRVTSPLGLLAYETTGQGSRDIAILSGQAVSSGAERLYSPQYAVGGPWRSTLSIVNLDGIPGSVMLRLIGDNGLQIGAVKFVNIAGGGKVYISDQAFFDETVASDPGRTVQGYVEVAAPGLHLAGSVVFGDARQGIFSSALPLVSSLQTSAIFSHVASDSVYFTGLAILNPGTDNAVATIDLYSSDGKLQSAVTQIIPAGQRISRLLTEYFPSLVGQSRTSGYFRVTADQGVACFALFGTQNLSVLSAIPAQPAF